MKKIVLSLAVLASVALVSCGNGGSEKDSPADSPKCEGTEAAAPEAEAAAPAVEAPETGDAVKPAEAAAPAEAAPAEAAPAAEAPAAPAK